MKQDDVFSFSAARCRGEAAATGGGDGVAARASGITLCGADLRGGQGVGDFARGVAAEWRRDGWAVALADRGGCEGEAGAGAGVFLQFVPYAWHAWGWVGAGVRREIAGFCAGRRTAVFMHELWVGESTGDALRRRWLGWWQRRGVVRLLRCLKPVAIVTSNMVYRAILAREGFEAEVWQLPGNLPSPTAADEKMAGEWWAERRLGGAQVAAVFGAIHPEWDGAAALRSWCEAAAARGREGVLLTLGRNGPAAEVGLARLAAAVPALRIERLAARAAGPLAAVLAKATVGVATTPWALIDKSGTVAAFRERGVPVVVTRDDWRWRRGETPVRAEEPGLRRWRAGLDWDALLAERVGRAGGSGAAARALAVRLATGVPGGGA